MKTSSSPIENEGLTQPLGEENIPVGDIEGETTAHHVHICECHDHYREKKSTWGIVKSKSPFNQTMHIGCSLRVDGPQIQMQGVDHLNYDDSSSSLRDLENNDQFNMSGSN